MYRKDLTKGTLLPIILKLLSSQKMYGYEITQRVRELTSDKIEISEGALYPILHKLEADGILETESVFIGKRVRKYYKVTETGKQDAASRIEELNDFIRTLQLILNPLPAAT